MKNLKQKDLEMNDIDESIYSTSTRTVKIRSGRYHNASTVPDHIKLFEGLKTLCDKKVVENLKDSKDRWGYRIVYATIGESYFAAALNRFDKKAKDVKTLPEDSDTEQEELLLNILDGSVKFYMDADNFILLQDSSTIPPKDFKIIMDRYVRLVMNDLGIFNKKEHC